MKNYILYLVILLLSIPTTLYSAPSNCGYEGWSSGDGSTHLSTVDENYGEVASAKWLERTCEVYVEKSKNNHPLVLMSIACADPYDTSCSCHGSGQTCHNEFSACSEIASTGYFSDTFTYTPAWAFNQCNLNTLLKYMPIYQELGRITTLRDGRTIHVMFFKPSDTFLSECNPHSENWRCNRETPQSADNELERWERLSQLDVPSPMNINIDNKLIYLFGSPLFTRAECIGLDIPCSYGSHSKGDVHWSGLLSTKSLHTNPNSGGKFRNNATWNNDHNAMIFMGSADKRKQIILRNKITVSGDGVLVFKNLNIKIERDGEFEIKDKGSILFSESVLEISEEREKPIFTLTDIEDKSKQAKVETFDNIPENAPPVMFSYTQFKDNRETKTIPIYIKITGTYGRSDMETVFAEDKLDNPNIWNYEGSKAEFEADNAIAFETSEVDCIYDNEEHCKIDGNNIESVYTLDTKDYVKVITTKIESIKNDNSISLKTADLISEDSKKIIVAKGTDGKFYHINLKHKVEPDQPWEMPFWNQTKWEIGCTDEAMASVDTDSDGYTDSCNCSTTNYEINTDLKKCVPMPTGCAPDGVRKEVWEATTLVDIVCEACPTNQYSEDGITCNECPEHTRKTGPGACVVFGSECPADHIAENYECVKCDANMVPDASKSHCIECDSDEAETNGRCEKITSCDEGNNEIAVHHSCRQCIGNKIAKGGRCVSCRSSEEKVGNECVSKISGKTEDGKDDKTEAIEDEFKEEAVPENKVPTVGSNVKTITDSSGCALSPTAKPSGSMPIIYFLLLIFVKLIRHRRDITVNSRNFRFTEKAILNQ